MPESTSNTKTYPKGLIYRDGDSGEEMFIIQSGQVKITKNMYGIMVAIANLGPGDYFGYMAFFEGDRRTRAAAAAAAGSSPLSPNSRSPCCGRCLTG